MNFSFMAVCVVFEGIYCHQITRRAYHTIVLTPPTIFISSSFAS